LIGRIDKYGSFSDGEGDYLNCKLGQDTETNIQVYGLDSALMIDIIKDGVMSILSRRKKKI